MCSECATFLRSNKPGRTLRDFLDSLPVPVLAVDDQAHVQIVNAAAEDLLGRPRPALEGHLGGDVMQCAYARLPGGCGQTAHCKACTIRRTVMATHETGRTQVAVTARQTIQTPEGPEARRVIVSTRKQGELVLLRLDEVGPDGGPPDPV